MKVCILSDSHDHRPLLEAAVRAARDAGAQAVLHCGDVVAPGTLSAITPLGLPIHVIHGNNAGDLFAMSRIAGRPDNRISFYGQDAGIRLGGRRIFLVHYPHYARAMATTGDWDLVCCGHDHEARIESIRNVAGGSTWLVDPGTVGGVGAPATYVLGNLDSMQFSVCEVQWQASAASRD